MFGCGWYCSGDGGNLCKKVETLGWHFTCQEVAVRHLLLAVICVAGEPEFYTKLVRRVQRHAAKQQQQTVCMVVYMVEGKSSIVGYSLCVMRKLGHDGQLQFGLTMKIPSVFSDAICVRLL
jgi:hypothetical protein